MPTTQYSRMREIVPRGLSTEIAEAYYQGLVVGVREMLEMDEDEAADMTMGDIDPFWELDAPTKTTRLTVSEARNLGKMRGLLVAYEARFGEVPEDEDDDDEQPPSASGPSDM
mmetsp:Transcript_8394/g.25895  ORF Transcript_8394/g.25895 Transcript_8394/m.25895 type:complete len:113 (-) Transcript_8394:44-382(-)